ncbi:MAG: hypothetical protein K0Q94_2842 [Paenibacillus sp.]|nr:hypothetical protein [Paenibacillus sp.]
MKEMEQAQISRRKLLAALGIAGAAAVAQGVWSGAVGAAPGEGGTVTQAVYGVDGCSACFVCTTVAELRANTAPDPDTLYYVTNRGQEGFFYYDAADTSSAENTGLVLVGAAGARFKRIDDRTNAVNATWFGAAADGVTDDTAALQATINAAIGDNRKEVHLQAGSYLLSGALANASDVAFVGDDVAFSSGDYETFSLSRARQRLPEVSIWEYESYRSGGDWKPAINRAIDDMAALGGGVIKFPAGTYNHSGNLTPKTDVLLQGIGLATLNNTTTTGADTFRRADDTSLVFRFSLDSLNIISDKIGASSPYDYQSGHALNLIGCGYCRIRNVVIGHHGGAAIVLAQANASAQAGNFAVCTRDGNYNTFHNVNIGSTGKNLIGDQQGAAVLLPYKSNSNKFYGLFLKGGLKRGIVIQRGNDNSFFGFTCESIEDYGVWMKNYSGSDGSVVNNVFVSPRMESVGKVLQAGGGQGACFYFGPGASDNVVLGGHYSTFHNYKIDEGVSANVHLNSNHFELSSSSTVTKYLKVHGLQTDANGNVIFRRADGVTGGAFLQVQSNNQAQVANELLGGVDFFSDDNSLGGNAVNARLLAVADDASGGIRFEFHTGGGNAGAVAKRLVITSRGHVIPELAVYSDDTAAGVAGLPAGAMYKTAAGEVRVKL